MGCSQDKPSPGSKQGGVSSSSLLSAHGDRPGAHPSRLGSLSACAENSKFLHDTRRSRFTTFMMQLQVSESLLPDFWPSSSYSLEVRISSFTVPYFLRDPCMYAHTYHTYDYKNTSGTHEVPEYSQLPPSEGSPEPETQSSTSALADFTGPVILGLPAAAS